MDNKNTLHSEWFLNLDPSEREDRKKLLQEHKKVLDILTKIVYNIRKRKEKIKVSDYSNTDWAYKQAHLNGMFEALRLIESIVDLDNGSNEPNSE